MKPAFSTEAQRERREQWFATVRERLAEVVNPDGSPRLPQFGAPYREPLWILPALYTGGPEAVALANRMLAHYDQTPASERQDQPNSGRAWNIFNSNALTHCLHRFGDLLTPSARDLMSWHARETCKTFRGSGQPDYKFHGANDNMPMMATYGMVFAGEVLDLPEAVDHGLWNLEEVRRLLSRSAWMSEFNSSTYSAITLSGAAKLATFSRTPQVRELAREIEHRLWAEVLLHYHPGTFMQAGPQCRAYAIDLAGHTHTLQVLMWQAFGPAIGRDPRRSYFAPDGREILHFGGHPWPSIAEFCDALDTDLHVPEDLLPLVEGRRYPAHLRGRSECMMRFGGMAAPYHTETYMEEAFSLGTVNGPLCGGEQTATCYLTYRRRPEPRDFRDAGTAFLKFMTSDAPPVARETSRDGTCEADTGVRSQGWWTSLQKRGSALLLVTPNLDETPLSTTAIRLCLVFPAHYGELGRTTLGPTGETTEVEAVTLEAGEVYVHVQPLLPTTLPRRHAVRLTRAGANQVLELVNFEGPERTFSREEAARIMNGLMLTVAAKAAAPSLEAFHERCSDALLRDYFLAGHRNVLYQRADVCFEINYTPDPFGVQTEAVDGRTVPRPVFESDQVAADQLPFRSGPVPPARPFFRWDTLDMCHYPDLPWLIGSRGLPGERPYSDRQGKP